MEITEEMTLADCGFLEQARLTLGGAKVPRAKSDCGLQDPKLVNRCILTVPGSAKWKSRLVGGIDALLHHPARGLPREHRI